MNNKFILWEIEEIEDSYRIIYYKEYFLSVTFRRLGWIRMDDKSFASEILYNTIDKLNLQQDWLQEYSNIFKDLFEQNKYDNQEEIYKAIEQGVNKI